MDIAPPKEGKVVSILPEEAIASWEKTTAKERGVALSGSTKVRGHDTYSCCWVKFYYNSMLHGAIAQRIHYWTFTSGFCRYDEWWTAQSLPDMADEFCVSICTVRRAIRQMEKEGLIISHNPKQGWKWYRIDYYLYISIEKRVVSARGKMDKTAPWKALSPYV